MDRLEIMVDPQTWFDFWNVEIHGISEKDVKGKPTFSEIYETLLERFKDSILVSHTSFDRVAMQRAAEKHGLEQMQTTWLDSARVVKLAWPEKYGRKGRGLANVAKELGIEFVHHNAREDAEAAAKIMLAACEHTGFGMAHWLKATKTPVFPRKRAVEYTKITPNKTGEYYGENVVFTGALSMARSEASSMAAEVGFAVGSGVTKRTTLLVVGTQDMNKLQGCSKSSKHRKAEQLIAEGANIQILSEEDFIGLVAN